MHTQPTILSWSDPESGNQALSALNQGQVLLTTTDTVLGLLAPVSKQGFEKLNTIKGRFEKPYIVLIGSADKIEHFAQMPLQSYVPSLIEDAWPGPLTIIVPAKSTLPDYAKSQQGTIALRVPKHAGLLQLLQNFDGLFSTSANKAGGPVPESLDTIDQDILAQVALAIVDERLNSVPSTIIDCTGSKPVVVRQGAYAYYEELKSN